MKTAFFPHFQIFIIPSNPGFLPKKKKLILIYTAGVNSPKASHEEDDSTWCIFFTGRK